MAGDENEVISVGPWGGQYGRRWDDDGAYCTIRQVWIASSAFIDSIRFEYDCKGDSLWSDLHGGGGGKLHKIKLHYPNEYLVSISGHCGAVRELDLEPVVVRSLSFESNRKKYGPFGIPQGSSFSLPISGGKLVGFHGCSSYNLDSIGVYVKLHVHQTPSTIPAATVNQVTRFYQTLVAKTFKFWLVLWHRMRDEGNSREISSREPVLQDRFRDGGEPRETGFWGGGDGGMRWDDGTYTGIREIILTRGEAICSIQIEYDQNGQSVWSAQHGHDACTYIIKFDYPHEILMSISGYYGFLDGGTSIVVRSLTFNTNVAKYGPFGEEKGIYFSTAKLVGKVVGFHGRSGDYLKAIGVHLEQQQPMGNGSSYEALHFPL